MSLEATPMKYNRVISTAVLFLLLGTTLPAFAQKGEEEKGGGGGKAQPAQHQAQPQRAQPAQHQAQPQRAQQAQQRQQPQRQQQAQRQQPAQRQAQPQRAQQSTTKDSNRSAHSRRNGPQGSRPRPSPTTVATTATAATGTTATIMAAFLTPVTVPISVTTTRSTWGVPR